MSSVSKLRLPAMFRDFAHANNEQRRLIHTFALGHRQRLAGQRRLVDGGAAARDGAVDGDAVPRQHLMGTQAC